MIRRWLAVSMAVAVGVVWYLLPASPTLLTLNPEVTRPIRGVVHVHTRRSDGTGTVDEIAAAARRAGLQFVIFTDHGDGTRGPDTPAYRSGVLCLDATEISTNSGHVVALGLPQTPYPLGGEVADVIEDVRRLGGISIAAHPDSARLALRWTDWRTPFDGLEWLNADSQWRDERWSSLGRSLLTYPFRGAPTLATLLDRPDELLMRWDTLLSERPVVAVAAADAHARLGPGEEPYRRGLALHVPSYEHVFRTMSISIPDRQLQGDASADAQTVLEAIRTGRVYSSIDALASPAVLSFVAASGGHRAGMGEQVKLGGPVMLRVEANAPAGSTIRLLAGGKTIATGGPAVLEHEAPPEPGAYRVEIDVPRAPGMPPVPWVVSNAIYVGSRPIPDTSIKPPVISESTPVYTDGSASDWRIEKSVRSEGTIGVVRSLDGTQLILRYGLGGTLSESPYVAAVVAAGSSLARFSGLMLTANAMHPMRLRVQLRAPGEGDRRWSKSIYLDETRRNISLAFDELSPLGSATGPPKLDEIRDLLFVVDTVNTKQGASGQVWLDEIRYVR
jgi:hypothetical protein